MKDKRLYKAPAMETVKIDMNPLMVMSPGPDNSTPGAPYYTIEEEE